MTLPASTGTEITIGDLHDLVDEEFEHIFIEVYRRKEPGAELYAGACFLTPQDTNISTFRTVEDALAFIDDIQQDGVVAAIAREIGDDPTSYEILNHLHVSCGGDDDAIRLFEESGMNDPFRLEICVYKQTNNETRVGCEGGCSSITGKENHA